MPCTALSLIDPTDAMPDPLPPAEAIASPLPGSADTTPPSPDRLFVYGTLAPGEENDHVLRGVKGHWSAATVRGRVIAVVDRGPAAGYPGIVLDSEGGLVHGLLFSSALLAEHWQRLDDFEGEGYERVRVRAEPAGGSAVDAWIYRLRPLD